MILIFKGSESSLSLAGVRVTCYSDFFPKPIHSDLLRRAVGENMATDLYSLNLEEEAVMAHFRRDEQ